MPALPRLRARTVAIDDPGELSRRTDPAHPALWLRRGDGFAARGVAWRGEFAGETRVADAAAAWAALVADAEIDDPVCVAGSGAMAFAAIAFDAASTAPTVLQVPTLVAGRRDGVAFATAITADGSDPVPPGADGPHRRARLPEPEPLGPDATARLGEGEMTAARHHRAIEHAIDLIRSGRLQKVVIARDLRGELPPGTDRRHVLARLASAYPECWTYAVDGLTGTSPEMLVRVIAGRIAARVLAGTARRGATPSEDAEIELHLRHNSKDRLEHLLAIDSAIAPLAGLDDHGDPESGITVSPEPFTLALPNVWHLASDIRGTLPAGRSVLDLVRAMHPTAAVGGTPTDAATEAIRSIEGFDRRRYAGPVGWLDWRGDGEFAVALRGAEIDDDGAVTAFAGGGIVADSDPADEYAETELKFRPVLEALCPAGAAEVETHEGGPA